MTNVNEIGKIDVLTRRRPTLTQQKPHDTTWFAVLLLGAIAGVLLLSVVFKSASLALSPKLHGDEQLTTRGYTSPDNKNSEQNRNEERQQEKREAERREAERRRNP